MTNNIYWAQGTALVWRDSGGDYPITMSSLAAQAGRIGARGDLGAWPRGVLHRWYLETAWAANPVANETLDFFLGLWDADTPGSPWAQASASDSAFTATQRQNLKFVGSVAAETAGTGVMSGGGIVMIPSRYISPVLFNNSAAKALAAAGTTPTILRLTPLYSQVQ